MAQKIIAAKTVSGNTPKTRRLIEKAGQTFLSGVPVQVDNAVDGGVKEWAGTPATDLIAGFSCEDGQNLATTGLGAPTPMSPATGVGSALTFGSVPNQASAKNIPRGGPFTEGRTSFISATDDVVFSGSVLIGQTTVVTDVGKDYGMTKDTDNQWGVDRTKTGAASCVTVVGLDPLDGPKLNGRVLFVVKQTASQIIG